MRLCPTVSMVAVTMARSSYSGHQIYWLEGQVTGGASLCKWMSTPLNYHVNLGLISHYLHTATSGPAQFKQSNTTGPASKSVADIFFEDTTWKAIRKVAQHTDFRGKLSRSRVGSSRYWRFGQKGGTHERSAVGNWIKLLPLLIFEVSEFKLQKSHYVTAVQLCHILQVLTPLYLYKHTTKYTANFHGERFYSQSTCIYFFNLQGCWGQLATTANNSLTVGAS